MKFKQELTKFELVNGETVYDMLDKAKLNTDSGMIYFVYFDGETGLASGRYVLSLATKSGLKLRSKQTLNVQSGADPEFISLSY